MGTDDQSEVVAFLSSPGAHSGAEVMRIETHASIVFLAGPSAWKLKRAVRYDYLDFSTISQRKAMCEAEFRLNLRTAPTLYRRVVAVTREGNGALALGGRGTPVDWVIEMARFDQEDLLDRRAALGTLGLDLMRPLARTIARFHRSAEPRRDHGGTAGMAWVIDGNALGFREQGAGLFDTNACAELTRDAHIALEQHKRLLDARRQRGFVRQCHGDLHLRNIVLLDNRPTLFDAIEFNDEIACIDILYDLAFLLMDLWRRRLPQHANALWNSYLFETPDLDGIPLLPLFLSCRAAVRAKTSASAARLQEDPTRTDDLEEAARGYLALSQQLLRSPGPCLVAVGGLSGSGKSTLAKTIAPDLGAVPGAVVIRSDEVRKQLCGVDVLSPLREEAYTSHMTQRVYGEVGNRAQRVIRAGGVAIVDAVYARADHRDAIERVARGADVSFVGLWLEAPASVLITRVEQRRLDVSDADAAVVRHQLAESLGPGSWRTLDATGTAIEVASGAMRVLRQLVPHVVRPGG